MYSVKQLSSLAGVSVRTLHYYDQIGLLQPAAIQPNGYRSYDRQSLYRLQQILFYRELGLDLRQIKKIVSGQDFDPVTALQMHRRALEEKMERLKMLIQTVDTTILHLTGELPMNDQKLFEGFSPEEEKRYGEEAVERWGETARQSIHLWNSYSAEKKQAILAEGRAIYAEIAANMDKGPRHPLIQSALKRWHQNMRYFYEPTPEVLRGLGEMYHDNPEFNATFTAIHPDLSAFLKEAVAVYVEGLEKG